MRQAVSNIAKVRGYDVGGQLLAAIKFFYKLLEVCIRANNMKTKPFSVNVGL